MANAVITVRIAFGDPVNVGAPTWNDVSADLMSLSIRRGRQHELNRIEAGTARITLLNSSGDYWPDNAGGTYYPNILPLKRVNIRATYGGTTYDLYTGFIESYQPDFILKPIKAPVMVINCVDLQKHLSNLLWSTTTTLDYSGTRVTLALSYFGWPIANRVIDTGLSLCQIQVLTDANVMEHIYKVCDSENGIMYIRGDGYVIFEDRHHRQVTTTSTTSQATFGDGVGERGYTQILTGLDDQFVYNDIHITRIGGTMQSATDATSITAYGKRTYPQTQLLNSSDNDCLSKAQYMVAKYKDPHSRVRSIVVNAGADQTNLYPLLFGLDISHRITAKLAVASVSGDYYIEAISHDWTAIKPGEWITNYQLSSASMETYWALGVTNYSELGTTTRLTY